MAFTPTPELQSLIEKLLSLEEQYPYSSLLIPVPSTEDADKLFTELCERALFNNSTYDSTFIKEAIKDKKGLAGCFLGYMSKAADRLRETRDIRWLHIGLGASILEDGYPDWRDYILAMADLYVTAEEAGLDPKPAFKLIGYDDEYDFAHHPVVCERRRYRIS
ncbi:hypothetical protein [Leptolinea tardivitalis]|uniref:Uncharacterized protein n=1 Tax=Leptolinea tardivitalis TaxID=229920 RepID=A0A0P6X1N2_9CHLR|nr:hypothetical protein [Leptolinea tardivitalis]KPL73311.1 hypothetical protein ADM99_03595 [Leptolinea tardivitalis]GAP21443.1 hypothetical protein LTAR_01654 [Leptolinea tardivitalis]